MELIIYTYQLCLSKRSLRKSLVKRDVKKAQAPVAKRKNVICSLGLLHFGCSGFGKIGCGVQQPFLTLFASAMFPDSSEYSEKEFIRMLFYITLAWFRHNLVVLSYSSDL